MWREPLAGALRRTRRPGRLRAHRKRRCMLTPPARGVQSGGPARPNRRAESAAAPREAWPHAPLGRQRARARRRSRRVRALLILTAATLTAAPTKEEVMAAILERGWEKGLLESHFDNTPATNAQEARAPTEPARPLPWLSVSPRGASPLSYPREQHPGGRKVARGRWLTCPPTWLTQLAPTRTRRSSCPTRGLSPLPLLPFSLASFS